MSEMMPEQVPEADPLAEYQALSNELHYGEAGAQGLTGSGGITLPPLGVPGGS